MNYPLIDILEDLAKRLREILAYSFEKNDPNISVSDPYISLRALTSDEAFGVDGAIRELFFSVRGVWPEDHQWRDYHTKWDRQLSLNSESPFQERLTNRAAWQLMLEHFTGAKVLVGKLIHEQTHQREMIAAKTPSNLYREIVMGDTFKNISNSSIVNRSTFFNALNALEAKSDQTLMELLESVAEKVEASGNVEAGEILEQLMEELAREEPRQSLIARSWTALTELLPDVATIAGATAALGKLV